MKIEYLDHMGSDVTKCQCCELLKSRSDFPTRNDRSNRLRPYCKECANTAQRARYVYHKRTEPFKHKCRRAKTRAKSLGVPFDLTPEYLESIWTGMCPVSGEHIDFIEKDRSDEFAAELDRFVPALGYVVGNVSFISRKMNRLKNSATVRDLQQLLDWMYSYEC